jgi:hypothetical protein
MHTPFWHCPDRQSNPLKQGDPGLPSRQVPLTQMLVVQSKLE